MLSIRYQFMLTAVELLSCDIQCLEELKLLLLHNTRYYTKGMLSRPLLSLEHE